MNKLTQIFIKLIILLCVIAGAVIIFNSRAEKTEEAHVEQAQPTGKALVLKKYLLKYNKPARVEVFNYTQKFDQDVNEIKSMKIGLNDKSNFYVTIQFFTDESDAAAPLVAQIRFLDMKTDNLLKEESINLE